MMNEETKVTTTMTAPRVGLRASSDVGALRAFGLAVPLYGALLLLASAAPAGAREILLERGWPPHATLALAALALAILAVKAIGLRRQRRAFRLELLSGGAARISPAGAAEIVDGVDALRGLRRPPSFLVERVRRVLAQYASRGEVVEASAANDAESDADAAAVAASYATVKVLVWAMPILGLIGTVIGLSGAVGAFSHAMSGAEQLDTIKDSLRQVTTGLAVAFDATFVALVASILGMLPMTWLQKAEDKLVNDVDDYCITHVLARLGEPVSARAAEPDVSVDLAGSLVAPLEALFAEQLRAMARLTEDARAPAASNDALAAEIAALGAALARTAPALERAAAQLERATAAAEPALERVAAAATSIDRADAQLREASSAALPCLERAVATLERAASEVESRVAPSLERAATQLADTAERADKAAAQADRTRDQLGRELGASRQLLSLLTASLGASEATQPKHHANGNGAHAASGDARGS